MPLLSSHACRQAFHNLNPGGDIFNHANVHFWDYTQASQHAVPGPCVPTIIQAVSAYEALSQPDRPHHPPDHGALTHLPSPPPQPGYDALGLISCTGTNFLVRAKAFHQVITS